MGRKKVADKLKPLVLMIRESELKKARPFFERIRVKKFKQ